MHALILASGVIDLSRAIFAALGMAAVFVLLVIAARVLFEAARPSQPGGKDLVAADRGPSIYAVPGTPRRVLHTSDGVVVQFDRDNKPSIVVVEPSPLEQAVQLALLHEVTKPAAVLSEPTPLEALEVRNIEPDPVLTAFAVPREILEAPPSPTFETPAFESSQSMAEHTASHDHGSSFDSASSGGFDGGGSSGGFDP